MNKNYHRYCLHLTNFILLAIICCLLAGNATTALAADAAAGSEASHCDRKCLKSFIDQYLVALARNDPSGLPLADNVVFVENDQRLKLGDGIWRTITGLGKYRHYFADPKTGEVAIMTTLRENGSPIMYDLRLKIVNRKITQIEDMPIRTAGGAKLLEKMGKPWPQFLQTIPVNKRVSRAELKTVPNEYLSGMQHNKPNGDYSFFDPECDRLEHGKKTTRNKPTDYGHSHDKAFVTMTCRQQFETGFLGFVTRIRDRRYVVVDEARQTVFGLVVLDHNGTIRKINMSNHRVFVIPPYFSTPRTLQVGEAWRMRGNKLYKIEMTLNEFPYGTRPQFGRDNGNWLKYTGSNKPIAAAHNGICNRDCLEQQVNDVLQAMLAHDPDRLPLAKSVKYTENGQRLAPGDGLWGTLTKLGDYHLIVVDEKNGTAGFYGTTTETDVPGVLTMRLKVKDNRIAEIEAVEFREEKKGSRGGTLTLMAPRLPNRFNPVTFMKTAPSYPQHSSEPTPAGDMRAVVNRFYSALQNQRSGEVQFTNDCQRRINGVVITNVKDAPAPDPTAPDYRPYSMSCAQQLNDGTYNYITRVRDQRVLVTDADRGLVMGLAFYDVANPATPIHVATVGTIHLPMASTGPYTIMAAQIFRITHGKIAGIDTMLRPVPYGMPSGW